MGGNDGWHRQDGCCRSPQVCGVCAIPGGVAFRRLHAQVWKNFSILLQRGSLPHRRGLSRLGEFYADAIIASGIEFDCLFGPAYKGIPLAAAVAIALHLKHGRSVPYAYNRKEAKDHGEGGVIVGKLAPRVLVVDDVITAGTAIRESMDIIAKQEGCNVVGVLVAMDRQEKSSDTVSTSAIQQVQADFGIPVCSICGMTDLISYLQDCYKKDDRQQLLDNINQYREQYGVVAVAGG